MTLDDDARLESMREAMARQHADDLAERHREWLEWDAITSPETLELHWQRIFDRMAEERPEVHYNRDGLDRRFHAVDGEIPEQARRDAEDVRVPWMGEP